LFCAAVLSILYTHVVGFTLLSLTIVSRMENGQGAAAKTRAAWAEITKADRLSDATARTEELLSESPLHF
jgi:hypothetical protein